MDFEVSGIPVQPSIASFSQTEIEGDGDKVVTFEENTESIAVSDRDNEDKTVIIEASGNQREK